MKVFNRQPIQYKDDFFVERMRKDFERRCEVQQQQICRFYMEQDKMKNEKYAIVTLGNFVHFTGKFKDELISRPKAFYRVSNIFAANIDYDTATKVLIEYSKKHVLTSNLFVAIVPWVDNCFFFDDNFNPVFKEVEETKKDMLSEANHEDIENSIQHQLDVIDGKLARKEISPLEHQDLHDNILK